jgi:signal transduction histidine kinase
MNSSLRSKLFLITYGIILSLIVGLIIFNNTILRDYYIFRRNTHLQESFQEANNLNHLDDGFIQSLSVIETEKNVSILVIKETQVIDPDDNYGRLIRRDYYDVLFGNTYWLTHEELTSFVYMYNQYLYNDIDFEYAGDAEIEKADEGYTFRLDKLIEDEDMSLIGLFSVKEVDGERLYFFHTITSDSIDENIWIFNSFTIVVGMVFMVLSAIVMYFTSMKFTNPILEINRVANEIANLNFSDKVTIESEDEIGQLAKSINTMSDELKNTIEDLKVSNKRLGEEILYKNQIEKERKDFVASASHELKTPLSLIMGYAEALKLEDLSDDDKQNYLDIVIDETYKMNKLVRDMLNFSQIESGIISIQKSEFSLKKLVESTKQLMQIKINQLEIDFTTDVEDVLVVSDYDQLQTVLINFINNAINHIGDKKIIKIYSEKRENTIRLFVYNTGNKISEEDLPYLWDSFYKADKARTRQYGGHGLGLSICKSILNSLKYEYGVRNFEGGVGFYFDINLSKAIEGQESL